MDEVQEIYDAIKESLMKLYNINCENLKCSECPFNKLNFACGDLIGEFMEGDN